MGNEEKKKLIAEKMRGVMHLFDLDSQDPILQ